MSSAGSRISWAAAIGAIALALAGCGGAGHSSSTATNTSGSPAAGSGAGTSTTGGHAAHSSTAPADPTAPPASVAHAASHDARQLPASVVAKVAGQPISYSQYRAAYTAELSSSAQGGVPLDPPSYTHCVAGLLKTYRHAAALPRPKHAPKPAIPSRTVLLTDCRSRQRALAQGALTELIQRAWTLGAAKQEHVTVPAATVDKELAEQQKSFGGAAAYARYLRRVGETPAQARQQLEFGLLEQQLQQRRLGPPVSVSSAQVAAYFTAHHAEFVLPGRPHPKLATYAARIRLVLEGQQRSQHATAATTAYQRHWRALTICAPRYTSTLCANG